MDPDKSKSDDWYVPNRVPNPRFRDQLAEASDQFGGPFIFYGCLVPSLLVGIVELVIVAIAWIFGS